MKEKGLIMKQSQEKVELAMLRGETVLPSWLEMEERMGDGYRQKLLCVRV